MAMSITRTQVLGFRVRAQQLHNAPAGSGADLAGTAILDLGVQDTGADGGTWALALRGVDVAAVPPEALVGLWTVRGAPHLYRRDDLPSVAAAVEPFSDADAGKRIFDAARPLKAAGIGNLTALDTIAATMRSVVTAPMVKGELSGLLSGLLDQPYLRFCRPCDATHVYEQPFRLAATRAGLELLPGTSPPVLRPIPGFTPAAAVPPRFDVIRAYLRLLGPATPRHVADYLDAPLADVKARWPSDAVEVAVDGERRWVLADDVPRFADAAPVVVRLLAPFDLFLQAKDRSLLVGDPARAKTLWPVLGRPGAVLVDGEIAGVWRPRKSAAKLRIQIEPWARLPAATRAGVAEQAERLAAHRGARLSGVDIAS